MPTIAAMPRLGAVGTLVFLFVLAAILSCLSLAFRPSRAIYGITTITVFCLLLAYGRYFEHRRQKIADARKEDSICSFARQLNCREIDTWIVRAVYEQLQDYFNYPPRLEDHLDTIDEGDLDDIAIDIAKRIGRPLENVENNPYCGKVKTVKDMILFFTQQPRKEEMLKH
jgi:hypothetical protein